MALVEFLVVFLIVSAILGLLVVLGLAWIVRGEERRERGAATGSGDAPSRWPEAAERPGFRTEGRRSAPRHARRLGPSNVSRPRPNGGDDGGLAVRN